MFVSNKIKIGLIAACLSLSACDEPDNTDPNMENVVSGFGGPVRSREARYIKVWIDPATGCHYIVNRLEGEMLPRLNREGQPWCDGPQPTPRSTPEPKIDRAPS